MDPDKIAEQIHFFKKPDWIEHHDHLCHIPNTNSFVFYPYNEDEAAEGYLNSKYNKYGYTVIRRPKNESEYNSGEHQTYKVLILEPNFDQHLIDLGCDLIAQYFREYYSKMGLDLPEK